ncbi:hypothetical protein BCIN_12g01720 [Botrytis cinerea B05.10]|uniref:Uncharacterized protein n=1 Tax=Botryotinia fuckeliana (strain B05.10) TaxID=332648 RepID=A0A384JYJ7_BOTFB|nr:hypothetical protein BCIN_12g01720 [Botrytis cinerea B05.10]ATZ55591.1 hypothetical protein BCIN_12g01720 [Botrytis cinerea B05.10]
MTNQSFLEAGDDGAELQGLNSKALGYGSKKRELLGTSNDTPRAPKRARTTNFGSAMQPTTATLVDTQHLFPPLQEPYEEEKGEASVIALAGKTGAFPKEPYRRETSKLRETSISPQELDFFTGETRVSDQECEDIERAIALSLGQEQEYDQPHRVENASFGVYNIPCAFHDLSQDSKIEGMTIEVSPYTAKLEYKFEGRPFGEFAEFADVEHAEWIIQPENITWMSYSHPKSRNYIVELVDNGGDEPVPLYIEFTGKEEMLALVKYWWEWMTPEYRKNVTKRRAEKDRRFPVETED